MKNLSVNIKIIFFLLITFILSYNYLLSINVNSTLLNVLFWLITIIISYILLGYTKNRGITKKQTIQYIIIYCLIYFLLIYFLGIITGFNNTPFSHSIKSLFKNIIPVLFIIVSKELVRYMLIFKCRFNKKIVLFINIIFILIDIVTVINLYELNTILLIFTFIGEVLITTIYNNSFETIISYNVGPIPSIVYRMILELYVYIVPIVPNLDVYLTTVINVALPVLLILCLNKLYYNFQNVSKKKVSISKKYITIPICLVLISLVCLVSGVFKYKIVAVASNSMLPNIARGDAAIYEKTNNIKEGDILVFKNEKTIYIHRIVEITKKDNEITIYTKGDNNIDNDTFTTNIDEVYGVVKKKIKYIGYPTLWISELF